MPIEPYVPVARLERLWRRYRHFRAQALRNAKHALSIGAGEYQDKCMARMYAWEDAAADLRTVIDEAKKETTDV